ncbi:hypothetical protein [Capnocytophaga sputigena]|uniref:hypothetical protein n=1 Tax=Capnocytophaga sputigena TaxID=1019 RepID=UPI000BB1BC6C|nr:hypothetical protein [Capnocytophaga sputigena]ATA71006.1 hypothetical protein CGC57_08875 [Capnocytophaga sputigena]VEI55370.1 Uncharacterised protein [Capnocytophaga sputigena]
MNEQARKLYDQAQANYPALKAQIEAQVVRWFWASGGVGYFSLEPFYFEQNRFSKSKILKDAPEDSDNKYQYGVNANDEIIVERSYTEFKGQCYETFYFREDSQIISYRFEYSEEKECDNVKIFIYKDGLLQYIYSAFEEHYLEETMYYEGNKLIRRKTKGLDYYSNPIDNTLLYTYDMLGKLNSITNETGYVYYQKKDKKVSYKKLSERVAERFYALLIPAIKAYPIPEPLYCLNIAFDYQYIMPPTIGFGTENKRIEWKESYGKRADSLLWNTADYAHTVEIETDNEDTALFELFNQETEMQERESAATKLLVACAKRLKEEWASLGIPSTDDFVVVVSDIEDSFLKKV